MGNPACFSPVGAARICVCHLCNALLRFAEEKNQMAEPEVEDIGQVRDELQQARDLLRRHGPTLGTALIVAAIVLGGTTWIKRNRAQATQRAAMMLTSARTIQDLEGLMGKYPRSDVAPLAALRLGKMHFDGGAYDLALIQYATFLRDHGDHPQAIAAELGRIHCLEAQGRFQEALEGLKRFVMTHPGHFRLPQALLGLARCEEQLGNLEKAKVLYEDFIAGESNGEWKPVFESLLEALDRRLAKAAREAPAVAVPTLPSTK